jgi:hypothetical protein
VLRVLLSVSYVGRVPSSFYLSFGARRDLVILAELGGLVTRTAALRPAWPPEPSGSDVRGGPCCGRFHRAILVLVRWWQ